MERIRSTPPSEKEAKQSSKSPSESPKRINGNGGNGTSNGKRGPGRPPKASKPPEFTSSGKRIFVMTEKQEEMAKLLAQYPEEIRRTKDVMKEVMPMVYLVPVSNDADEYLKIDIIFELAKYIADGLDYEIQSAFGYVSGLIWTDTLERFCWEYVCDPSNNVRRASKKAGLPKSSANRLLKTKEVRERINEIREERNARYKVDADRVLEKLLILCSSSLGDFIEGTDDDGNIRFRNIAGMTPDELYPLQQITRTRSGVGKFTSTSYKLKLEDRGRNLTLLMRHLGMLDGMGGAGSPEETGNAIRKWAQGMEDFVPGGEI